MLQGVTRCLASLPLHVGGRVRVPGLGDARALLLGSALQTGGKGSSSLQLCRARELVEHGQGAAPLQWRGTPPSRGGSPCQTWPPSAKSLKSPPSLSTHPLSSAHRVSLVTPASRACSRYACPPSGSASSAGIKGSLG